VTCSAFSRTSSSTPRCEMESAMRTFGRVTTALNCQVLLIWTRRALTI